MISGVCVCVCVVRGSPLLTSRESDAARTHINNKMMVMIIIILALEQGAKPPSGSVRFQSCLVFLVFLRLIGIGENCEANKSLRALSSQRLEG